MEPVTNKFIHNEILFKTNFHLRTKELVEKGVDYINQKFKEFDNLSFEEMKAMIEEHGVMLPEDKSLEHTFSSARNAVYQKYRTCLRRLKEHEDMTTYDASKYDLPEIDLVQGDYIGSTKYRFIELLPFEFLKDHMDQFSLGFIARNSMTCACCMNSAKYFIHSMSHKRHNYTLYTSMMEPLTVDHIHPRAKGGRNSEYNYQVMCQYCNVFKADRVIEMSELRRLIDKERPNFIKYQTH